MANNRFFCFVAGMSMGMGVTLLLVPKAGKQTRQLLADKVDDGKDLIGRQVKRAELAVATAVNAGRTVLAHS